MSGARTAVMTAMRRRGDETQLTRTITELAKLDPTLAPQIADAILATSADAGNKQAEKALEHVPRSLVLAGENGLGSVTRGRRPTGGRLDWDLTDDSFRLGVEVKIGATSAEQQLERYLADLVRSDLTGGLVLVTRSAEKLPHKVTAHKHWLGQIRWDALLPRLARIRAADPAVGSEWDVLLSVVRRNGDLGMEPVDWQLGGRRVGDRNRLVLAQIRDWSTELLATALATRAQLAQTDGLCGARPEQRGRSIVTSGDSARLTLYVPASKGQPVIEVELAGTRAPLKLATAVDPAYPPVLRGRNEHADAVQSLVDQGFGKEPDGWYAAHDRVARTDDAARPADALRPLLEGRLRAIVASGILDSQLPSRRRRR